MQEKVLLFNFHEGAQLQAIRRNFFLIQAQLLIIPKGKYGMPLKMLMEDTGSDPITPDNRKELDAQMIVFAGMTGSKLESLLTLLAKDKECGEIPYKAILTETNQYFNAFQLLEELKREHAAMHRTGENGGTYEKK